MTLSMKHSKCNGRTALAGARLGSNPMVRVVIGERGKISLDTAMNRVALSFITCGFLQHSSVAERHLG